eukprot:gnl/TRDRNA2_/TRDRNA2_164237_c0_seq4.p1 gnl/TRDRNA2_/TRDRNA2_164237_c0~~gnl/TRDRNA2_/TRDRNA2_164237_c0_seq4.p1  ORF type:complete len:572 (+),score=158.61 gnl/TRDRNA2_/TRDRNA2_164237_c0_seq4:22-1737(+)
MAMTASLLVGFLALMAVHAAQDVDACAPGDNSQQCAVDEAALVQKDMFLKQEKKPDGEVYLEGAQAGSEAEHDNYKLRFGSKKVREFKDLGEGLTIKTIKEGNKKDFPKPGTEIACHYIGRLADGGKVFDSNEIDEEPFRFTYMINRLIPGWEKALQVMSLGEKSEIFIPAALGYGIRGASGIPSNADLVFEVMLKQVGEVFNTASDDKHEKANSGEIFKRNQAAVSGAVNHDYRNETVQNDWLTQEQLAEHRAKGDEYGNQYAPAITGASSAVTKVMDAQASLYKKMDRIRGDPREMEDVSEQASRVAQGAADFVTDRRDREQRSKDVYWEAGNMQKRYVKTHTDHDEVYHEATKENIFHHLLNGLEEGIHKCMYDHAETMSCGIMVALPHGSGYSALKGSAMPAHSAPSNNIASQVFKIDAMTLWYSNYSRTDCCATYKLLFENKAVRYYEAIFRDQIPDVEGDESREIGVQTAVKYYAGLAGLTKDESQSLMDKFSMPKAKAVLQNEDEAAVITTLKHIFQGQPSMQKVTARMSETFGDVYDDFKTSGTISHGLSLLTVALGVAAIRL